MVDLLAGKLDIVYLCSSLFGVLKTFAKSAACSAADLAMICLLQIIFNSSRIYMSSMMEVIWTRSPSHQLTHVNSSGIGVPELVEYPSYSSLDVSIKGRRTLSL